MRSGETGTSTPTGVEEGDGPAIGARRRWGRLAGLALAVTVGAAAAWHLPVDRLPGWIDRLGPVAAVAAVLGGAALLLALVPRTAVSLACGALFGAAAGAGWALTAALLAAVVTFYAGRWAGAGLLRGGAGRRVAALDRWLAARGVLAVTVVRLLPIAPFGLMGYAYGTSTVRSRHYLAGTALGAAPSAVSYATIGAAVTSPGSLSWVTFIPAAAGIAVSSAAALHWRRRRRADHRHTGHDKFI